MPPTDLPGLRQERPATPEDLPGLRAEDAGPALSQPLDFIDDQAAQVSPVAGGGGPEVRVRKRNGEVLGPHGLEHVKALLRAGQLTGNEDISTDGASWRAMTSHRELNETLNQIHAAADPMSFGQVDLPISRGTDLPGLRTSEDPSLETGGGPLHSDGLGDLSLDTGALPSVTGNVPPQPSAPPAAAPLYVAPPPDASLDVPPPGAGSSTTDFGTSDAPRASSADDVLDVGEIPDLPPIWQTYRKPILAFVAVAGVVLVGVFSHLFTPYGVFGIPGLVRWVMTEPPPPAPEPPPPPPPVVADPTELAALFEEGSYEAFRSIFATVQAAGPSLPDNRLVLAKARALATESYGDAVFPREKAQAAIEALQGVDLAATRFGAAAETEALIARALLSVATGNPGAYLEPIAAAREAAPDRAELAWVHGLLLQAAGQTEAAEAALDAALEADPEHAAAELARARLLRARRGLEAETLALYDRAVALAPPRSHYALEAAEAHREAGQLGAAREARRAAAESSARGLPPPERAPLLLEVVSTYDALGRLEEVTPLAKEAARLEPAKPEYAAMGALAEALTGDPAAAITTLDALLQREPESIPALLARARARYEQQDLAKAFLDLEAIRSLAPRDPRVPLWEGRFNLRLGKLTDARQALTRAVRLADTSPAPVIELGRTELEGGDVDAAFDRAKRAVAMAPTEARAHVLLGDVYVARAQSDAALEAYRRAVEIDGYDVDALLGEAGMLRERAARSDAPAESEALAEALAQYEAALEMHPDDPRVLFELGRALELKGENERALSLYTRAAEGDARDPRPHLRMTAAFVERDPPDTARAQAALQKAQSLERQAGLQMADVRFWEARVALLAGDTDEAISSMRQAVEKEPRNAEYHYWLGRALQAENSLYEAIAAYEKAVSLNSRFAAAQRALGWTELERHRFSQARAWFTKYRDTVPDDPSIHYDIGESWVRQNRDDKALTSFRAALKDDPENPRALLQVGRILSRRGQEREALRRFEKVVALNAANGEAWCLLGISRARRFVTPAARKALNRCLELTSAPADLQETAREILETADL